MVHGEARTADVSKERLTWVAICERFPDQWVVLADADWVNETDFEFATAEVVSSHATRRDASPSVKAARSRSIEVGCFWTGEIRGPAPRLVP